MKYINKNLTIEKVKVQNITKNFGTPVYCYSYKKLNELGIEELKKIEPRLTTEVLKIFNVKNSVNSKKSFGGTSFDNIKKMIMKYKKA